MWLQVAIQSYKQNITNQLLRNQMNSNCNNIGYRNFNCSKTEDIVPFKFGGYEYLALGDGSCGTRLVIHLPMKTHFHGVFSQLHATSDW